MTLPRERVEVLIVGSGAAGSAMAAYLAEAGRQVHILEAGPERHNRDLVSSTLHARRLKWHGEPVLETGDHRVGYVFNSGSGTGGSAMHHYAVWPRFHPEDFDMHSRYGRGLDWPIGYEDLAPYYDRVQRECGIAGDAKRERWRPPGEPYPMPAVPVFAQGAAIARGFDALGMHTAPLPLAVTSTAYHGRKACLWDGWCDAGCPIGALANPLTVHLPRALGNGAVIHHDCRAVHILTSADGKRVDGVEVVHGGERAIVRADLVVLAAFSVQTPRLLLASANERHPNGLANASGRLGHYVMTHSAGLIYGLFADDTRCHMGAFGGQLVNQDGYDKETHAGAGAFGSYQWMIAQAVKPNDLLGIATTRPDLMGADVDDFMRRAARGFATMTAVVEDLPVADNRVTLAAERDADGVPLASVHHSSHPASRALWQATLDEGRRVFDAAGAVETWTGPQGAMHIIGGTVMGDDPATSVTNPFGQVHELPNLVIAGPGLFPTSAGVNPTFTVHALTARAAEYLIAEFDTITL